MSASAHLPSSARRASAAPKFQIVAETDDYLVVDKPPFLLIHPSKPDGTPTLWAALRELLAFELVNGGQVSIVNRLDRETSGLVLIAKNREAARRFGKAMERQQIKKEYLAIVHGWPEWETTIVDAPLARQGEFGASAIWLKQAIHERGALRKRSSEPKADSLEKAKNEKIGSQLSGRFRELGGRIRSVFISRISAIRLWVTRSTGLTRNSICNSSRPVGPIRSPGIFSSHGTRSIPRGSAWKANWIGKVHCQRI
jgi:hypothetical protein